MTIPDRQDVSAIVAHDYDLVEMDVHEAYDSTNEFAAQIESFSARLPHGASVLVVGGSVAECSYFSARGFIVTNLDVSGRMVEHVSQNTSVRSIQSSILDFSGDTFDGIWACRSLIHLHPDDLLEGLRAARRLASENGWLGCTMFTSEEAAVTQQAMPAMRAGAVETIHYRCLYSETSLRQKITEFGWKIVKAEQCADQDGDLALYIEAK